MNEKKCPECGGEVDWTTYETPHGECDVPSCKECDWEGEPE